MEAPNFKLTGDIIKQCKNLTCDCGGILFREGALYKKLSAIISPTGKEEVFPITVIICESCGKVPTEFNVNKILPEELLATKSIIK